MLYRHTPLFQAILQRAVDLARHDLRLTDAALKQEAGLDCSVSILNKFRVADLCEAREETTRTWALAHLNARYLNVADARRLWEWLSRIGRKSYIDRAISAYDEFSRIGLYDEREVANALASFYGCHESQLGQWIKRGIEGEWICYKKSFRREGFIVKSKITIQSNGTEYLSFFEHQRSSGRYETDKSEVIEDSTGIGLSKSHKLWFFTRELSQEQPRIFSVIGSHAPLTGAPMNQTEKVSILTGRIMESDRRFAPVSYLPIYYWNIVLVKRDVEEKMFKDAGILFDISEQIDLFPFDEGAKSKYGSPENFYIHDDIREAIVFGNILC